MTHCSISAATAAEVQKEPQRFITIRPSLGEPLLGVGLPSLLKKKGMVQVRACLLHYKQVCYGITATN